MSAGKADLIREKHGGFQAASFVLVVEALENLAFLSNASNLVTYLVGSMHLSPSRAANAVTNFMGTAFLLALLGGFLSDAVATHFRVFVLSALLELLGLIVLTVQARSPVLKPPPCYLSTSGGGGAACHEVSGREAAMLFSGLYIVSLGVGCIKGSLAPHGAEQFDDSTAAGRRSRSTFFNYYIFSLSSGGLIAVTFVVWIEDNMGWQWGFAVATIAIILAIAVFLAGSSKYRIEPPHGSPLTTVVKVLIASLFNSDVDLEVNDKDQSSTPSMQFLNRAVRGRPFHKHLECTAREVEEVKVVFKILPIFLSTIMLNCCLAQLSTFSVQQAATMSTRVGDLVVPPASLSVFPITFIMFLAPIYDHVIIPIARKTTKSETGITHLQRIGVGLVMSVVAMVAAALVEGKRMKAVRVVGDSSPAPLKISFFWVSLQYLFLGSADLFTLAGLMEFFFTEAPSGMRSLATALSWASLAMGYYLSSGLVSLVNGVTKGSKKKGWLQGDNLNQYELERFYWLMCVLSAVNFAQYLFWAIRYRYRTTAAAAPLAQSEPS